MCDNALNIRSGVVHRIRGNFTVCNVPWVNRHHWRSTVLPVTCNECDRQTMKGVMAVAHDELPRPQRSVFRVPYYDSRR